jgi:hypothetical protein
MRTSGHGAIACLPSVLNIPCEWHLAGGTHMEYGNTVKNHAALVQLVIMAVLVVAMLVLSASATVAYSKPTRQNPSC